MRRNVLLSLSLSLVVAGCAGSPKSVVRAAPHEEPDEPASSPSPAVVSAAPVSVSKESTGVIPRSALTHVLDEAPGRFLQHVEIVPRFSSGRFHGWRLVSFFPGDPRFASVDLQSGDVVTSVNGQPIEQPDQLMKVWDSLRQEPTLTVSVERDGRPRQLRYDIRD